MATYSVKSISKNCLGKNISISIRKDILTVYGNDNPQSRSLKQRLQLIQGKPFVRIALVTIVGANPKLQLNLDNANLVLQQECDVWVYVTGSIQEDRPNLLFLDQNSCPLGVQNFPTDEEDELFSLGRNQGADIVGYYIQDGPVFQGCSSFPAGRRGFWVDDSAGPWIFAHELVHVVGFNAHVSDPNNLMFPNPGANPPPDLTEFQCNRILGDPGIESC